MSLDRDPEKARAWQDRSRQAAIERARQKPRSQLKARSPRKRERYAEIAQACGAAIERDGHRCQARLLVPEISCGGKLDPQHVIPQGVDKRLAAEEANIVACCRRHHDWIGDHPEEAQKLGLHGRWGDDLAELAARRSMLAPGR